jgi:hypothetical protein
MYIVLYLAIANPVLEAEYPRHALMRLEQETGVSLVCAHVKSGWDCPLLLCRLLRVLTVSILALSSHELWRGTACDVVSPCVFVASGPALSIQRA